MSKSPHPTVERTRAIKLQVHGLVKLAARDLNGLLHVTGDLSDEPFVIRLQVRLDSAGPGTLRVWHSAFRHMTEPVPQQDYDVPLEALPCRFGGWRWYARCPITGTRAAMLHLPNGAARFASRGAFGLVYETQRHGTWRSRLRRFYRDEYLADTTGPFPESGV